MIGVHAQETAEISFDVESVTKMEKLVLNLLDWHMNAVTAISYVDRFLYASSASTSSMVGEMRSRVVGYLRGSYSGMEHNSTHPGCTVSPGL